MPLTNHPENKGEIHEKMVPYGRKEKIIMDWSLIVQIGILGCLLWIIFFLHAYDVVNTKNVNSLHKYLDEIKENQEKQDS